MAAWGLKEQRLPAPSVDTRLCTWPHDVYQCLFLTVSLSPSPFRNNISRSPHLCLVSHSFFILIIILLKIFN